MLHTLILQVQLYFELHYVPIEEVAWYVAGFFAALATLVTFVHMFFHVKHFSNPIRQKCITRVLLMVPVYAIGSFLSLRFLHYAVYLDLARDCYEALTIYSFITLMVDYAGGHSQMQELLNKKPDSPHMWPMNWFMKPYSHKGKFLWRVKQCTLQYVVVKPLMAVMALLLEHLELYEEGHFRLDRGYAYITIINNLSVSVAMYALLYLYVAIKHDLHDHGPTSKILCIKGVLFVTFWQSVACSFLVKYRIIRDSVEFTASDINTGFQDFLVCLEMLGAAIAHAYAYHYSEFERKEEANIKKDDEAKKKNAPRQMSMLARLVELLNPSDLLRELYECYLVSHPVPVEDRDDKSKKIK
eukprot:TRINITY_DN1290_c0_g1_i1.p1 TRINITY_DN1290_c0_g1~~TRINITY_DN1290_c0_g1_i1.p1  ORF type:complete len:356 (-),score=120.62 TRINITY_DN1290_c0_g1_i1:35-1102(-)